ncbi:EAL domain-containing protein [Bordetella sp. LUAb4]|uniref:EAL domain-containing protein n=1 Tax=Bordetella sp. LUAb4 TaxID=2843195 RepID=UPI001E38DFDE|nr:EAL domain-containing protein [Bordetella sp. LUAb4]
MRNFFFMRPLRARPGAHHCARAARSGRLPCWLLLLLASVLTVLPGGAFAQAQPAAHMARQALAAQAAPGTEVNPPAAGARRMAPAPVVAGTATYLGCTMLGVTATGMMAIAMGFAVLAATPSPGAAQQAPDRPGRHPVVPPNRSWLLVLALALVASGAVCLRWSRLRPSLAAGLESAMGRNQFQVCYQPIVDVRSGDCVGIEAVFRWRHPVYGELRPEQFMALAEQRDLAARLTRHLLRLVDQDLRGIELPPGLHLGLNVAAKHLREVDAVADFEDFLYRLKDLAPRLILELTERETLQITPQVLQNLQALRGMGVAFALDDFGTGHSSLAYLEQFTLDYLKIDAGLVAVIGTDAVDAAMLELVIALGARLGVGLVAEGVQTCAQADYLAAKGVAWGQGNLYAGPMSGDALRSWLKRTRVQTRA